VSASAATTPVRATVEIAKNLFSDERFRRNFLPVPATSSLRLGQLAPNFTLPHVTANSQIELASFRNKQPVVVAFTRIFNEKTYCPLCFPHLIELRDRYAEFTALGAEVLLVTSTDFRQSQQVASDLNLPLPLLSDSPCNVFRRYGTGQALGAPLPAQFAIDSSGKIRFKHFFSFLHNNAEVDTLLAALRELQATDAQAAAS